MMGLISVDVSKYRQGSESAVKFTVEQQSKQKKMAMSNVCLDDDTVVRFYMYIQDMIIGNIWMATISGVCAAKYRNKVGGD